MTEANSGLTAITPGERGRIRALFEALPGLDGCIAAILDGDGEAFADDAERPCVAAAWLKRGDFHFMAGDAEASAAATALMAVPAGSTIVAPEGWAPLIERIRPEARGHERVAFRPGAWHRAALEAGASKLPAGFTMRRVTSTDVARFVELDPAFAYNFRSHDDFLERGVGYAVEHVGRFVAGCSSFAIGRAKLEIEIETHRDFQRRGLAFAVASRMIAYCLDAGLEPCWDAHNPPSAALATKLGFQTPRPYTSFVLPRAAEAAPTG